MNRGRSQTVLITGGAGFIGCNLADRLAQEGFAVRIYDNLSRPGVEDNLRWLLQSHGSCIEAIRGDVTNERLLRESLRGVNAVFHLAAQVAVTTSLCNPVLDFDTNLRGTLTLLEALRESSASPAFIYTSTNKVYGCLRELSLLERPTRWTPAHQELAAVGISETQPLEFCSPYGCSKGAADQYILDYARSFGLSAVVFRMSCIYGPHQRGTEDQGWVAHFLIRALASDLITIYGDGKQVRDVLFVDDLVDAFVRALAAVPSLSGRAFNIGGGPRHSLSLLELLRMVEDLRGRRPRVAFADWRVGDQRYYVSDTRAFERATGWKPLVPVRDGVEILHDWLAARQSKEEQSPEGDLEPLARSSASRIDG